MEKIIQIIPAPEKMRVHYENHSPDALRDKNGNKVALAVPVACLALVEMQDGYQEIRPVTIDGDGCHNFPTSSSQFLTVTLD